MNYLRFCTLFLLVGWLVLLVGCGDEATSTPAPTATPAATPTPSPAPISSLQAIKTTELNIPFGPSTNLFLSPDGRQIFWLKSKDFCFYAPDGTKELCNTLSFIPDANSVRWSPGSRRLALHEDYYHFFLKPHIWLLEAATGKLTNLTDDHFSGKLQLSDQTPHDIDVGESWSRDGKQLLFLRYQSTFAFAPALYTINPDGGAPVKLGELKSNHDQFAITVLNLSPDGKQIAYNVADSDLSLPQNGLWLADGNGQNPRQLIASKPTATKEVNSTIVETTFSADGRFLLGLAMLPLSQYRQHATDQTDQVVNPNGGSGPVDTSNAAHWSAWSPTGNALAYLVVDGTTEFENNTSKAGLYLVDQPGGTGKMVQAGKFIPPYHSALWRGLTWAANNSFIVMDDKTEKYYLIQLGLK